MHRVVIVGGGFGGLCAGRALRRRRGLEVTLVDRRNHHLFQPLLYQVATGGLSPANVAAPLRSLLKAPNILPLLAEVVGFDLAAGRVLLSDGVIDYDSLVVAAGAETSYFGRTDLAERARGLKSLEDATAIRRQVLLAFERAERSDDPEARRRLLTFVVVGGGPTGVELAGALAELAYRTLRGELRRVDPRQARILLVEGADRVLPPFPRTLSSSAARALETLGVEVRAGCRVEAIGDGEVTLSCRADGAPSEVTVEAANVFWAAGVRPSPLAERLAEASGAPRDRQGRILVEPDCSLPGHPQVFAIGDLASYRPGGGDPLPGLAPVAMQQGRYVARLIRRRLAGKATPPFRYRDKGNMATIGRHRAVADIRGLRFAGPFAWLTWLFVHLMYLVEFENRVLVLVQWAWSYVTRNRSARLITGEGPGERGT